MKRFFYASAAILMLSLAFHFGYATARAQAPGNPVVAISGNEVLTANGDVYAGDNYTNGVATNWRLVSNVFTGAPTPALHESWGHLKSRYAPKSTPAPGTPTDR
jgi:hypothetical protein